MKEDIEAEFGEKFFPVMRNQLDDAVGYREASLTDPFTGSSRWSPRVQEASEGFFTRLMGKDAYKRLSQVETVIQSGVAYAKENIIVRSIVVSFDNTLGNVGHLATWGISPVTAFRGMRDKTVEIQSYVRNTEAILKLTTELASNLDNPKRVASLRARIQALEDANARLSIKPLIDAGEFSTVAEDMGEADRAIRDGKWVNWVENQVDRLPGGVKTAGKNLLITKDTALFKGLNRVVQYSDFVAKAVLYDHLIQKKKMPKRDALDVIFEEFVAYNRLPGRTRRFLEGVGLIWLFNYKLRIMKIATKMIRERPLSALLFGYGAGPALDIDTVFDGTLVGSAAQGKLPYAFGPGMAINSATMNPWATLVE